MPVQYVKAASWIKTVRLMSPTPHPVGAHDIDEHFRTAPFESNLPVLMGLLGVWNISFLGYPCRAILPYAQALSKLAPHIQQVGCAQYLCMVPQRIYI